MALGMTRPPLDFRFRQSAMAGDVLLAATALIQINRFDPATRRSSSDRFDPAPLWEYPIRPD